MKLVGLQEYTTPLELNPNDRLYSSEATANLERGLFFIECGIMVSSLVCLFSLFCDYGLLTPGWFRRNWNITPTPLRLVEPCVRSVFLVRKGITQVIRLQKSKQNLYSNMLLS